MATMPFIVALRSNPEQTGIAVSEHVVPMPNPDGTMYLVAKVGVLWEEIRSPSPAYHNPEDLEWIEVPGVTDEEEDPEEEEEENEEEEAENA